MEDTKLSNAVDEELLQLQEIINNVKNKEDVGELYMTLQEMIDYEKRDSYVDGHIRGIIETYKSLGSELSQAKDKIISSCAPDMTRVPRLFCKLFELDTEKRI